MGKPFNVDDAVMGSFNGLIGSMRAKRLSAELPMDAPPEQAEAPDDSGDDAELESMLGDYEAAGA